jgi:hypothetical protein
MIEGVRDRGAVQEAAGGKPHPAGSGRVVNVAVCAEGGHAQEGLGEGGRERRKKKEWSRERKKGCAASLSERRGGRVLLWLRQYIYLARGP